MPWWGWGLLAWGVLNLIALVVLSWRTILELVSHEVKVRRLRKDLETWDSALFLEDADIEGRD